MPNCIYSRRCSLELARYRDKIAQREGLLLYPSNLLNPHNFNQPLPSSCFLTKYSLYPHQKRKRPGRNLLLRKASRPRLQKKRRTYGTMRRQASGKGNGAIRERIRQAKMTGLWRSMKRKRERERKAPRDRATGGEKGRKELREMRGCRGRMKGKGERMEQTETLGKGVCTRICIVQRIEGVLCGMLRSFCCLWFVWAGVGMPNVDVDNGFIASNT
jgi:hypothetical protein